MKCEHCQNPATIHVTHVAKGKVVKTHLCEGCAAKLGISNLGGALPNTSPPNTSLADSSLADSSLADSSLADSSLANTLLGPASPILPSRVFACPNCGLNLRKFQKEGRLGCPECYQAFSREISTILTALQESTRHIGRSPRKYTREPDLDEILKQLHAQLTAAVQAEAFEEAARLRDEIQEASSPERIEEEVRSP